MKTLRIAPYGCVWTQHGWAKITQEDPTKLHSKLLKQDGQIMVAMYDAQGDFRSLRPISSFSNEEVSRLKQALFDF